MPLDPDKLLAAFYALDEPSTNGGGLVSLDADADLRAMLIDWSEFWTVDHNATDWLTEPIIATGRSHALFAPGGTGKSLLALWLAAAIATGRPIFGHAAPPRNVLYLDYEMTEDDLAERLEAMGYGADVDLSHLHYALLPSLPGLDEPEGGKAVVRLAELCDAQLVIIDTFGRAVHGDENDADTVRAWYRWTGLHLKAAGRAFVRVDHAGKDLEKGQRGTSAKNDDVDIVWQMTRQDGDTFRLTAKKRRMGWVPDKVDLTRSEANGLDYALVHGTTYPDGTKAVADALNELGVPVDASRRDACDALKAAGRGARTALVTAAQKWRRAELPAFDHAVSAVDKPVGKIGNHAGNHSGEKVPEPPAEPLIDEISSSLLNGTGNHCGNHAEPLTEATWEPVPPLKGEPVPAHRPEIPDIFN